MAQDEATVFQRAFLRIVTDAGDADPVFRILDSAGGELRRERCFDDARAWLERRLQQTATPARPRAGRSR